MNSGQRLQWLEAVQDEFAADPAAVALALAIQRHHNADTGACIPSQRRLAALIGRSPDTVRRKARELASAGFLAVVQGSGTHRGNPIKYRLLNPERVAPMQPLNGSKGGTHAPLLGQEGLHPSPRKGGTGAALTPKEEHRAREAALDAPLAAQDEQAKTDPLQLTPEQIATGKRHIAELRRRMGWA